MNLIIQEEKNTIQKQNKINLKNKHTRFKNQKKFTLLVKVLVLFLRCPILVLAYNRKL
jgi:hypothetical protein